MRTLPSYRERVQSSCGRVDAGPIRWTGPVIFLAFFLFLQGPGKAQTLPPKLRTHGPEQYDAHSQVFSSTELPHAREAFGTNGEVLVHDGERFEHVGVGKGKDVLSMDSDSAGRLFIGGSSLMGVIGPDSNGTLTFRSLQPLLPDSLKDFGKIWNTRHNGAGVYFNANDHLFYYEGDSMRVIRPRTSFGLLHHPSERVVIREHDHGLLACSGTELEQLPGSDSLTKGKIIMGILEAAGQKEKGWTVLTQSNGLYHYEPSTGNVSPMKGGEGTDSRTGLREARIYTASSLDPRANPYGASYAVGTILNGLYLLDKEGRILLQLGRENGLPSDLIWQVNTKEAGHVRAVGDNGITLLQTGLPFTVAQEGKQFSGYIEAINRNGHADRGSDRPLPPLYLATRQGAYGWEENQRTFSMIEGSSGQCSELYFHRDPEKSKTRLLIARSELLLSIPALPKDQKGASSVDTVSEDDLYDLTGLETPYGPGILTGGRAGLYVLVPPEEGEGPWKELLSIEDAPEEIRWVARGIVEGEPDSIRLWAGLMSKGILSVKTDTAFTGYELTHYEKNGLPEGQIFVFPDPSSPDEKAVFGTDQGLYRFDKGSFIPDTRYGSLFANTTRQIFRLEQGTDGEIWISDERGGQVKHLLPEGEAYRIDSTVFRALSIGGVRSLFSEQERTWIGGNKGLAAYFPGVDIDTERDWQCRLSQVRGSGDSLLFGGTFFKERPEGSTPSEGTMGGRLPMAEQPEGLEPKLPYSKNRMEFVFAAPFPTKQEAVRYSYKLSGFDTAWSKWSKETKKEYTNLPEGDYSFQVKARNVYGKVSSTSMYRFTVLPPWYRSWGAYTAYSLASIAIVWSIVRLNARRLEAQKRRLELTVEARTKEIQQKNRALQKEKKAVEEQKERVEEQQMETEKQKEKVEEAHQEITRSIDYAQKIQYALLQTERYHSPDIPDHFIFFQPQAKVSGDFYWAKEHQGYFYIAAVDCTGHGVPGAFMSMLGISQLNEILATDETPTPGYVLTELRSRVVRELGGSDPEDTAKDGMDAAMVKIPTSKVIPETPRDPSGEQGPREEEIEVEFAGAQNPLYVIRKGIADESPSVSMEYQKERLEGNPIKPFKKTSDGIEVKGDGQPVGYDEYAKAAFTTVKLRLHKGDMLYFFSDGYADQFGGPKGKKFRYGPFKRVLTDIHNRALEEQKEQLAQTFDDWKQSSQQEQVDDVLVIGVRL